MCKLSSALLVLFALCVCSLEQVSAGVPGEALVASEFIYEKGPYRTCHASSLVETASGRLLAAWFGGSNESRPDVCIYVAVRGAEGWSAGELVADGVMPDGQRYPTWNPVLFQRADGELLLFYKVGPSPSAWWGMVKRSRDEGRTWEAAEALPKGVLGPIKNKPVELEDGTLVCGSSTEDRELGWQVHMELLSKAGRWTQVGPLNERSEFNAIQPTILDHGNGRLQILCRTVERVLATAHSEDSGRTWSRLSASELYGPNSGFDVARLQDGRFLLLHNYRKAAGNEHDESGRCPLNLSVSRDGVHWEMVMTLESVPTPHGYAYPAIIQSRDGLVHASYTCDRRRIRHVVIDPAKLAPGR